MSSYPHTRLFVGSSTVVAVSGLHLQILDAQTGNVLHTTHTLEESKKEAVIKSGPVRCVDTDSQFRHVAASGEDKKLKVWRVDGLELLSERELPKKPTEIHFTRDGQTILVSDKFGDIFSYPLHPDPSKKSIAPAPEASSTSKRSAIISHENPSDGTLILGHTSLLTTFVLTEDEKYVISADRDEHIRVSWHPQGYVIERFCLGHRKFVSAVHVPKFAPSTLISGGGDPELKLWDWMSGEHLGDIPIFEAVKPFIAVRPPKGRASQFDEDGDEPGADAENVGKPKGKGKKGKGKTKKQNKAEAEQGDRAEDADDMPMIEEAQSSKPEEPAQGSRTIDGPTTEPQEAPLVLVVSRILSADVPDQGKFVMFSAVGATAVFYFAFSEDTKAQQPIIQVLDLHRPIIDFYINGKGDVWVLVDGDRQIQSADGKDDDSRSVRLLRWVDGKLSEGSTDNVPSLLTTLNSLCKIPATPAELKALDVYSALASLPKNVDPEHDPMRRNDLDALEAAVNPFESSARDGTPQAGEGSKTRELTQREAARLKRKQALEAHIQQDQVTTSASPSVEPESRQTKKVKAYEPLPAPLKKDDVEMKETA